MDGVRTSVMSVVKTVWRSRWLIVRFGTVGVVSTSLQLVLLFLLTMCHWPGLIANATGFVAGAQVSFVLSTVFIWRDRHDEKGRRLSWKRWFAFNCTALSALCVGSVVFTLVDFLTSWSVMFVSLWSVAASTSVTFLSNNLLTYRRKRRLTIPSYTHGESVPDLSIIIPAYREAERIGGTLQELAVFLAEHDLGVVEVVVVTADSDDGTADIVADSAPMFTLFRHVQPGPKVGKGRDVAAGMRTARGRYRVFMDADLATPLRYLLDVRSAIDAGHVAVIGVRDIGTYHNSLLRNLLSRATSMVVRLMVVPDVRDTQCGFKMFEASLAEYLFSHMRVMSWNFDMEILLMIRNAGLKIHSIHVPDWRDPKPAHEGMSGDSRLKAVMRGAIDPLTIRYNLLAGRYGTPNPSSPQLTMSPVVIPEMIGEN